MSGLLAWLFGNPRPHNPAQTRRKAGTGRTTGVSRVRPGSPPTAKTGNRPAPGTPTKPRRTTQPQPRATVLQQGSCRPAVPYWQLRGWRRVSSNVYLGYYKTRLGRRHGVIKWNDEYDFGFYVHDVPVAILNGPHGACFEEVKPGKFRVHFAQFPKDLNSGIFYVETLLQEAFENG